MFFRNKILLSTFRFLLFPFALIYESVVVVRRKAFQKGWLRPATFHTPTICVGNLCMGGAGKTPHVEYIAKLLSQNFQVAILSRGYGRKTKGYINASKMSSPTSDWVGDEIVQYIEKFPNVKVAVCESRKEGIKNLLMEEPELQVIILDDAYQHLSVNYSLKIVLTEYDEPYFADFPIPAGRLREPRNAAKYADIIIVTKCPEILSLKERDDFIKSLKPQSHQEVFFTKIKYIEIGEGSKEERKKREILLITGIAHPEPLVKFLETQYDTIHKLHFPDHHVFTNSDIERIIRLKDKLGGENCTVLTTEKDAARLAMMNNMPEYHTIPIEIVFLEKEDFFKKKLLSLLK